MKTFLQKPSITNIAKYDFCLYYISVDQKYQIISRKQDIGRLINQLHREEFLAVGIMDTGTKDDLIESISWFSQNFNYCLHVVTQSDRITQDSIQTIFPDVTFIVFPKIPSLAERINAFANVCMTTYFIVTQSNTSFMSFDWKPIEAKLKEELHPAVICPWIFNKSNEKIPTVRAPKLNGKEIEPMSFMPRSECDSTLYPFLGLGIYDRALFQRLRGYDNNISGTYWQTLDFGVRCWLFGYPVYTMPYMSVLFYGMQFLIEDRTELDGVERFYTKNLAIKQSKGRNYIKKGYKTSGRVLAEEVKPRLALYKTDFQSLCDSWKNPS